MGFPLFDANVAFCGILVASYISGKKTPIKLGSLRKKKKLVHNMWPIYMGHMSQMDRWITDVSELWSHNFQFQKLFRACCLLLLSTVPRPISRMADSILTLYFAYLVPTRCAIFLSQKQAGVEVTGDDATEWLGTLWVCRGFSIDHTYLNYNILYIYISIIIIYVFIFTYAYICCCMLWSHITLSVPSFSVQCSAWGLVRGRCGRTRIQSFSGPWW